MKRDFIFFVPIMLLLLVVQVESQNQNQSIGKEVDDSGVPRVSAYEAYVKYKAGKAIILFGGGEQYRKRHIVGSIDLNPGNVTHSQKEKILLSLPKDGIEIFTYCY
jgi:hypothetical protein